jgi:endonuclease/exonuclease/phosphatase family metal-dependent hydrolase
MSAVVLSSEQSNSALRHSLRAHYKDLARFSSSKEMESSSLYQSLRPEIDRILNSVICEEFSNSNSSARESIKTVAWNIERGIKLEGIIKALQEHPDLKESDLLLLTELDNGMARTKNRNVPREIAEALNLNYAFAPCYIALTNGSGVEAFIEGENTWAIHGNALMSRYPILNAHSLALPNGKDKMKGVEKRLGCLRAVIADIDHPHGMFRAVSLHLDAHSTQSHRHRQMKIVLDHLEALPKLPTIIGGDWNTTTFNSSRAVFSILGYCRRVLMGVRNIVHNHYPHPDRWFERKLFREIEKRGYNYKDLNEIGVGTLHYNMNSIAQNTNLGDWVPRWCFWFIFWALEKTGGRCSLKLDWFTGKDIEAAPNGKPKVICDLKDEAGVLSDHDAIVLEFVIKSFRNEDL